MTEDSSNLSDASRVSASRTGIVLVPIFFASERIDKSLPGKPDLVFPKYHAVIFVHGCFWHMHNCHLFKWPSTREAFWKEKITGNSVRDKKHVDSLVQSGWRVLTVWECAVKGKTRLDADELSVMIADWLKGSRVCDDFSGK